MSDLTKDPISEDRLRNTRAWASARPDMSGSEVIVGAIDELIRLRRDLARYENAHKVLMSENQRLTAELLKEQLDFRAHLAGCKSEQAPEVQK